MLRLYIFYGLFFKEFLENFLPLHTAFHLDQSLNTRLKLIELSGKDIKNQKIILIFNFIRVKKISKLVKI